MTTHDVMALPRRHAWPALLILALVVALALQFTFERGRRQLAAAVAASAGASAAAASPSVSSPASPSAPAAASAAEPQWGQAGEAAARVARAASAALATARAAAGLAPAGPVDTELALCGVGRLNLPHAMPAHSVETPRIQAAWDALPPALAEPARRQAWRRVQAALAAPGQPERARAAAWLLLAAGAADAPDAASAASAPASAVSAARSLARLARGSRDTTVLRWALAICSRESPASAECRRLSARDLTRLSPDDGLGWLQLAGAAGANTAAAGRLREQALDRASRAERFGSTQGTLAVLVDTAWPDDLPGYLRLHLLRQALALDADLLRPVLDAATAQCTAERMAAPGRREACDRLVRNLLERAREGALLDAAAMLAARLAWSEADMQPLKAEEAALLQATASLVPTDQPYACPVLDDTRNWVRSVATDGELQAARRRLAMKPTTARPAASRP